MKHLFLVSIVTLQALALSGAETTAELKETSTPWLPTRYFVHVALATNVPASALNASMFRVERAGVDQPVRLTAVTYAGFESEDTPPTYGAARLYGSFSPAENYAVTVFYPGGLVESATVESQLEAPPVQTFFQKISRNFDLTLEAFVPDEVRSIGLRYDLKYHLPEFPIASAASIRMKLASEGEVSTEEDDSDVQNAMKGGLTLSALWNTHWRVRLLNDTNAYRYVYPLGFQLKPAEFEVDRDFDFVDYTGKIMAGGATPYLDYPVLLWSRLLQHKVSSFPPTIFIGYTLRKTIEEDASRNFGTHRIEGELVYHFPLADQWDLKCVYRGFYHPKESEYRSAVDVGLIWYIDLLQKRGLSLSFQDGSLPPEFRHTHSFRLGFVGTL
jgi:hypothetical protein